MIHLVLIAALAVVILMLGVFLFIKVILYGDDNFFIPIIIGIITLTLTITILVAGTYQYANSNIKKIAVCQNGNIEITGKNNFGILRNEEYEPSRCTVEKSNTNVCYMDVRHCEIQLTSKYYTKYIKALLAEKSVNIYIKN